MKTITIIFWHGNALGFETLENIFVVSASPLAFSGHFFALKYMVITELAILVGHDFHSTGHLTEKLGIGYRIAISAGCPFE